MHAARWRPVCPDCGYSLRGACSDRCPECGAPYPTAGRAYRRWAIRRLPWDRRSRGSSFFGYLKTACWIILCPWSAARHVALPDRSARAARWAGAHILLGAVGATLLCNDRLFSTWLWRCFVPDPFDHPLLFMSQSPPGDRILVWFVQAFTAWFVLLAGIPAMGIALAFVIPGHRAWQQCAVKWSCYATVTLVPIVGLWYAWYTLFPVIYRVPGPVSIFDAGPAPELPPTSAGAVFGMYWAVGLCSLVYRRRPKFAARRTERWRRRPRTKVREFIVRAMAAPCSLAVRAAPYAALFAAAWWVLRCIAFPAGSLEALR